MKRIGILTGGGDCPGLNAVIRAAVRTLTREHGLEVVGIQLGFEGLLTRACVPLTLESIRGILPKGGTLLRTTNRGNPFEYPMPDGGCEDRSQEVVANIHDLGIDGIIAIGGDGTLKIAQRLCDLGIPMVAVPKTIDNDLAATDYTFGFHTAVAVATDAVDRLHTTAESHDRVMILEVMGRNAGWIALYAGIAGGADIILIPEMPYRPDEIVATIRERQSEGSKFDIIVVAEGAKRVGGEEAYLDKASKRLGGVAYQVAAEIQQYIDLEIRVTVLGHVQRGGSPIAFDRILASRFGKVAADLVASKNFGQMVAVRADEIVSVPIIDAVSRPKYVDPNGQMAQTARSLGISFGDGVN
ncbi:MAG TPA: ATP-dependent 6-phosphofructokinase [Thermoanaerobaculia bacterium]|jgi:6-phosphofructokinase 1|nr:ATP-dependent 6-phosphofructokinase [Thermoanaerobaculia bacterium]